MLSVVHQTHLIIMENIMVSINKYNNGLQIINSLFFFPLFNICKIGVLQFPVDYPFKPPSIRMITPSGK